MDEDDFSLDIPMSQQANEVFNPVLPRPPLGAPTSYAGLGLGGGGGQQGLQAARRMGSDGGEAQQRAHGKLFADPVHQTFRLGPACIDIIDSPAFQRLRRLKQLGVTYYVFPGASHNRFEHSLGVAHLASRMASHIYSFQRHELGIEPRDLALAELAGLCHDLGHGPFSHVFDREFLKRRGVTGWEHEDMSCRLVEHIIDTEHIGSIEREDLREVQSLIKAGHAAPGDPPPLPAGRRWLADIVANGRNGIDVDKFDYLARDSLYCGVKVSCDFNRLFQFAKVLDDEICYRYSEYMNLHELFHSRAIMHRQVYTHRKAKAVEYMVVDALCEADPALRLSEKAHNPEEFLRLDDSVLEWIENWELFKPLLNLDVGSEAALRSAQRVIGRMRRRDLYKYCSEALVPQEDVERGRWARPSEADIVNSYPGSSVRLRPEDVIVCENTINYSMRSANPLDRVHFYDYLESTEKRGMRHETITSMMAAAFQENTVRVYSRVGTEEHVQAVREAFDEWVRGRFRGKVVASTPCKPARPARNGAAAAAATAAAAEAPEPAAEGGHAPKRRRSLFGGSPPGLPLSSQPRVE